MDKKKADAHRMHFRKSVGGVPVLLVDADDRWGVVIVNEGSSTLLMGRESGTISTLGMGLPANEVFMDTFSVDAWWALFPSITGTVSGYYMR